MLLSAGLGMSHLPYTSSPPQLALFGGDVVHNGLEHLAQLGLNATGLRRLLAEPVRGRTLAAVFCTLDVAPHVRMPPCLSASAGSTHCC